MRRLTVVQVLPELESGGVEQVALDMGRYLASQGHRSIVISAGGRMVSPLVAEGSKHITMDLGRKSLFTLKQVRPLRRLIAEFKPDVIDVLSRMPAWIVYLALRGMPTDQRPKWITSVHTLSSVNAYSGIMTRGDRVVVVSNTVKNYIQQSYPKVDGSKLVLVPRGIDTEYFCHGFQPSEEWLSAWSEQFPQLNDKPLLLLPGRLSRSKGHADFISLIHRLKESGCGVHGLIMGEADRSGAKYVAELKAQIEALGLDDDISFIGQRSDVREIMAISRIIYSLSPKPEAFGLTVSEAISLGRPVLGYAHGGVAEQLDMLLPEGQVKVGNIDELTDKTLNWLKAPPTVLAQKTFTLERCMEATVALYGQLAETH